MPTPPNHHRPRRASRALLTLALLPTLTLLPACGPSYIRSGEDSDFEDAAMSTRLDKKDLERLFKQCSSDLFKSGVMKHWRSLKRDGREGVLAILPVVNETSEHIDGALQALLKKLETELINEGDVAVVSRVDQPMLIKELKTQQGDAFDPLRVAEFGQQLGAQYLLTGRVYDVTEKAEEGRRVQYFLFMQVVEVATGRVRWQVSVDILKGLVKG
jgi:PBP1b-binding outer membrane lipoprotein LpoB